MDRKIKVDPLPQKDREALVNLMKHEHEPVTSDAICGPIPRRTDYELLRQLRESVRRAQE